MRFRPLAAAALVALAGIAAAEERPSDEDIFGAPAAPAPAAPAPATPGRPPEGEAPPKDQPAAPASGDARGDAILGGTPGPRPSGLLTAEREDWLELGGLAYWRAFSTWTRGTPPSEWTFAAPALLDVYLDARPNDRVRAFALGRLHYDPSGGGLGSSFLGLPGASVATGPTTRAVLDQYWLNFDADRTVFVTAGKQHVKWGTGRFWNPTDYLHPVRRDPLAQFDDRTGVTMVKAHLPWERRGWNLYGIALLEDLAGGLQPDGTVRTVSTLGDVGWGGRAEVVLGSLELAADGLAQRGHPPRFGVDGSFALWELDVRFEAALRRGRDLARWEPVPGTTAADPVLTRYREQDLSGFQPAAVVGAEWVWKYSDEDTLVLGGEYSYDAAGYESADIYPFLLALPFLPGTPDVRPAFLPFYLARHYLGLYLVLPAPGRWNDTTFTLSALGSLTDGSAVIRLDHSVLLNTYLTLETFVAGHAGHVGGEFRFGGTIPPQNLGGGVFTEPVVIAPPVLDLGVALRVKL